MLNAEAGQSEVLNRQSQRRQNLAFPLRGHRTQEPELDFIRPSARVRSVVGHVP